MELFSPVKRPRVHEEIVERIKRLIIEGRLSPGDRLPPERELAATFKVSRNSLRDALLTLELMGLVECRHGDGIYVTCITPETLVAPLAAIISTKRDLISELMDARMILEPPMAYCAAERATAQDIGGLRQAFERQEEKTRSGDSSVEEDSAFHGTIARATKNQVLLLVMNHIIDLLKESHTEWTPERAFASLVGHANILSAIERRDPVEAHKAMASHIEEIGSTITRRGRQDSETQRR